MMSNWLRKTFGLCLGTGNYQFLKKFDESDFARK